MRCRSLKPSWLGDGPFSEVSSMNPAIPAELFSNAVTVLSFFFTVITVLVTFLLAPRG
jgi:hypothetical protein